MLSAAHFSWSVIDVRRNALVDLAVVHERYALPLLVAEAQLPTIKAKHRDSLTLITMPMIYLQARRAPCRRHNLVLYLNSPCHRAPSKKSIVFVEHD